MDTNATGVEPQDERPSAVAGSVAGDVVGSVGDGAGAPDTQGAVAPMSAAASGRRRLGRGSGRGPQPTGSVWRELPILILIALILAILLKTFLVQAFFIPSGSMQNTLQIGDRVMVNKVVYHLRDIKRGDIVVFDGVDSFTPEVTIPEPTNPVSKALAWFEGLVGFAPPSEKDFIKRVIGIPGDHVACCDSKGRVSVNGVPLDESAYLYPGNKPSDQPFDIVVPPGRLWVMGDHRAFSSDSRAHLGDPGGGTVPEDKVIGRAFVVIWPVAHWRWLSNPSTFDQGGIGATTAALSSPLALGFVGAAPLVAIRRRGRRRRASGRAGPRAEGRPRR
jgi:signal peptidase I